MVSKYYRINRNINAPKVRLVDFDAKQVGIVSIEDALQKAHDEGLDLVEIGPNANPPVCKILDFEKFKYEKTRQEKEAKKKTKEIELKEVRFGPFVSEHDLNFRLEKAKEFLKKGNKVKLTINFTGRQMRHTEFGDKLLDRIIEQLGESVQIDQERRFAGRQLSIFVGPKNK